MSLILVKMPHCWKSHIAAHFMCDSYLSFTAIVGVVLSRLRILSLLKLTFYTIFSSLVYFHIFFHS